MTYTIIGSPSNGSLGSVGSDGSVVYTPNSDYGGQDTFTYKVNDGTDDSNVATVSLDIVISDNEAPVVTSYTYPRSGSASTGRTYRLRFKARDADGDDITYAVTSSDAVYTDYTNSAGELIGISLSDTNTAGTYTIAFDATDSNGATGSGTITVNLN